MAAERLLDLTLPLCHPPRMEMREFGFRLRGSARECPERLPVRTGFIRPGWNRQCVTSSPQNDSKSRFLCFGNNHVGLGASARV